MNEKILEEGNLVIRQLYNPDIQTFQDDAIGIKTKEMPGLVVSPALRCNDCLEYHLIRYYEKGVNRKELFEILVVGNIVGGTVVISHTQGAVEFCKEPKEISEQPGE